MDAVMLQTNTKRQYHLGSLLPSHHDSLNFSAITKDDNVKRNLVFYP